MNAFLFFTYVMVSAAGLVFIKQAAEIRSWRFAAGSLMYGAGFFIWLWLLRRLPLSMAFPAAAGALIAATAVGGYVFLAERLSAIQVVGIALILVGILFVYARSAQ